MTTNKRFSHIIDSMAADDEVTDETEYQQPRYWANYTQIIEGPIQYRVRCFILRYRNAPEGGTRAVVRVL